MVTPLPVITSVAQDSSQSVSTVTSKFEPAKRDAYVTSFSLASGLLIGNTIQSKYSELAPSEVVIVSSASVTGAQVTPDLRADQSNLGVMILRPEPTSVSFSAERHRTSLVPLPKVKISTEFEPHLRHVSVKKIKTLMTDFQHSVGLPEISAIREELKETLLETYKRAVLSSETRSFATAISMIQNFLRPHWTNLPKDQIAGITEKLNWLDSQRDLGAATLTKFYRDMVGVVGSQISLQTTAIPDADDDVDDNEEND